MFSRHCGRSRVPPSRPQPNSDVRQEPHRFLDLRPDQHAVQADGRVRDQGQTQIRHVSWVQP